ncbi:MAG: hypothetical protein CME67_02305 [Halobacteriovoraceae bacterium]|nr:hypothetical protein [Halobacteriovoraceae bacterium]|tara:strand:- start:114 stop:944 length:831 start_codon:yes stop_codon:yes gene_type:complete
MTLIIKNIKLFLKELTKMITSTSVVTHTFNQNKELLHLIRGLIKSNFRDELIIVAIGEEDPSEVLEEDLPFSVKLLYLQRPSSTLPLAQAKNIGFSMAQGEAIVFLEPNQIPTKDLFKNTLEILELSPNVIVTGRRMEIPKLPHKNWSYKYLHAKSKKLKWDTGRAILTGGSFAMLKSLYIEIEGFEERYFDESANIDFYLKADRKGYSTVVSKDIWTYELKNRCRPMSIDLDKLIETSILFYTKWGSFPSPKFLKAFEKKGLIILNEGLGTVSRA